MRMFLSCNWLLVTAAAAPLAFPLPSLAADNAAEPAGTADIQEVLVTARRKEERAQSVPLSITAISGEQFQRSLMTKVEDLRFNAPSLAITPSPFGSLKT